MFVRGIITSEPCFGGKIYNSALKYGWNDDRLNCMMLHDGSAHHNTKFNFQALSTEAFSGNGDEYPCPKTREQLLELIIQCDLH